MQIKFIAVSAFVTCGMAFGHQPSETKWVEIPIPGSVETKQELTSTPAGWQGFDEIHSIDPPKHSHDLLHVGISLGHPREGEWREPDTDTGSGKESVFVWQLAPDPKKDYWVNFSYSSTRLSLCKPLPHSATQVRVTINRQVPNTPRVIKVEFR